MTRPILILSLMVSLVLVAGLVAAMAFASYASAVPNKDTASKTRPPKEPVPETCSVVLDPGHGGTDWGAVNNALGLKEKEQNLDVALRLKPLLEGAGYSVCLTRDNDKTLSNADRYTFANSTGAKILVSIHMNASSNTSTDYTTTLFGKWQKDKELALDVYDGLRFNLPAASGSGMIQGRTPYSYASGVLLKSNMPATIAETVFITNTEEAKWLANQQDPRGARQQQIAEALEAGIVNYLTKIAKLPN